ncbi:lysine exporter LysO family protein [Halosquirtibacter xylanolyticus]|uniref:LysO family transporter n=1 Tax=Halosquirtibacter xylanolyticus TaxID=3374599 RepID=UPI003748C27A|nr:lysine exporter LysO family protein [Prolixibacteraceae bacterium]
MLLLIFIMVAGIVLGYLLRNQRKIISVNNKLTTIIIYLLLFVLGYGVGADEKIISNLFGLGKDALLLTAGAVAGSIFFVRLVEKKFFP